MAGVIIICVMSHRLCLKHKALTTAWWWTSAL